MRSSGSGPHSDIFRQQTAPSLPSPFLVSYLFLLLSAYYFYYYYAASVYFPVNGLVCYLNKSAGSTSKWSDQMTLSQVWFRSQALGIWGFSEDVVTTVMWVVRSGATSEVAAKDVNPATFVSSVKWTSNLKLFFFVGILHMSKLPFKSLYWINTECRICSIFSTGASLISV
jgi:hypothetical protein